MASDCFQAMKFSFAVRQVVKLKAIFRLNTISGVCALSSNLVYLRSHVYAAIVQCTHTKVAENRVLAPSNTAQLNYLYLLDHDHVTNTEIIL